MVAVWEGQDMALFKTDTVGADKNTQKPVRESNTKQLLRELEC